MKRLIETQDGYCVSGVASNRSAAPGLAIAQGHDIPIFSAAQKPELWDWIASKAPDLVLLAGYMQIVAPETIAKFPRKIINIHPALLPALPGLDTHGRALREGHKRHGVTVHIVDCGVDTGEIIAQAGLDIETNETEESLAARVLALEHQLYPWVVSNIAKGEISLSPTVTFSAAARNDATQRGFLLP